MQARNQKDIRVPGESQSYFAGREGVQSGLAVLVGGGHRRATRLDIRLLEGGVSPWARNPLVCKVAGGVRSTIHRRPRY